MTQHSLTTALLLACLGACSQDERTPLPSRITGGAPAPQDTAAGHVASTDVAVEEGRAGTLPAWDASQAEPAQNNEPANEACASASITPRRVTPDVHLLIDGSGSMVFPLGEQTRWSALREALLGSAGVVPQLSSLVKFGIAIYSWDQLAPDVCPALISVDPALDNLPQLTAAYPLDQPGGGTPTGEALQKLVDALPDYSAAGPGDTPPIIILATDGEPTGCRPVVACDLTDIAKCFDMSLDDTRLDYGTTFAAVRAAQAKHIAVWVVSLAEGLNQSPDLQATANIGAGLADDAVPGAPIYSPTNPEELTQTLTQLVTAAASCEITLAGELNPARACEGQVLIDGQPVQCDQPDGWKVVDATHIVLQGAACAQLKSSPLTQLEARFACDVLIPE
ncbi:MAG: vWA domain-containing protein [Polyangiales bacterium]